MRKQKNAGKVLKQSEKVDIWSFSGKTTHINCDKKYFPGMSRTQADPTFFNTIIDIPSKGLLKLQYCKPINHTFYMMEDPVLYVKSKIKSIIANNYVIDDDLSDTDSDESDESVLLGQPGYNNSKHLSSETLN